MSRISFKPGKSGALRPWPKKTIAGVSTNAATTPPPTMMHEMRVPMTYPTPSKCGAISPDSTAPLKPTALSPTCFQSGHSGMSFHSFRPTLRK